MMKILSKAVGDLVQQEYALASEQHGPRFHSLHEAYAVMKEELEEAEYEFDIAKDKLDKDFWRGVRFDSELECKNNAQLIKERAENAAAEMIQLAAMAYKAMQGFEEV